MAVVVAAFLTAAACGGAPEREESEAAGETQSGTLIVALRDDDLFSESVSIERWSLDGRRQTVVVPDGEAERLERLAHDRIIYGRRGAVYVLDITRGRPRRVTTLPQFTFALAPDERQLAMGRAECVDSTAAAADVAVRDLSGARQPVYFPPPPRRDPYVGLYPIHWSADSGTALFLYQRYTIDCPRGVSLNGADLYALDVRARTARALVTDIRGSLGDMRLSPDGRSVAYVGESGAGEIVVRLATPESGGTRTLASASGGAAELAAAELLWSLDGKMLVYTVGWSVYAFTPATGSQRRLHEDADGVLTTPPPQLVGLSRDGREVAFVTGARTLHVLGLDGSARGTSELPVPPGKAIVGLWGAFG